MTRWRSGWPSAYQGLKALGVPEASLASFAPEFQQGMAARAAHLGDVGESAPEQWEKPLGSPDVHLVVVGLAQSDDHLKAALDHARDALRDLSGVVPIWRQDVHVPADLRNALGFADGISHPAVAGSGIPGTNPHEEPLKAGEFVLGYEDETYTVAPVPQPEVLGRNGTYVVFRKLHTRTAAFRQYLHQNAKDAGEEEWLGAKIVGRWPSGAPLSLAPDKDDPELGADPSRNNAFMYGDDPQGLKCPVGSHVRRMNPRDAVVIGQPRIHRMIRRGTTYGPPLPAGVMEDDGVDRGLMFAFVGAHLDRQFEFIQSEWINDGKFIGSPADKDPLVGTNDGGEFTIPKQPIRRRLQGAARLRRQSWRRVLLHARPEGAAVAGRSRLLKRPIRRRWQGRPAFDVNRGGKNGLPGRNVELAGRLIRGGSAIVFSTGAPGGGHAVTTR